MDAIDKDLRQVLGRPVSLPHSHLYCGGGATTEGSLPGCRTVLLATASLWALLAAVLLLLR